MCQQWFSVGGLVLDVIGVVMIIREWQIMFNRHHEQRVQAIDDLYARLSRKMDGVTEVNEDDEHWSMGKHMSDGLTEDVRYRGRLVYTGVALVILGFICQVLGSWPYGVFGIRSC
jgi:hypothetical protein